MTIKSSQQEDESKNSDMERSSLKEPVGNTESL